MKHMKGRVVIGVCAGRLHSVLYTADGVFTCGLNAGHLGTFDCFRCEMIDVRYVEHVDMICPLAFV